MAYDIVRKGDNVGVTCADCKEVVVSQFAGQTGELVISYEEFDKIEGHTESCCAKKNTGKNSKKKTVSA